MKQGKEEASHMQGRLQYRLHCLSVQHVRRFTMRPDKEHGGSASLAFFVLGHTEDRQPSCIQSVST